jgi:PiT family inorganic phosphate transporter
MFSVSIGNSIISGTGFDFINGFHDTAKFNRNISNLPEFLTKASNYNDAAVLNFCRCIVSSKVAHTISSGLVNKSLPQYVIISALSGSNIGISLHGILEFQQFVPTL